MPPAARPPRARLSRLWAAPLCALLSLPQAQAQATEPTVLRGVRLYAASFTPASGERSLLAQARTSRLDWSGTLNLFASKFTDSSRAFLDWRGVAPFPGGPVFTTLRAATYAGKAGRAPLLVVQREWCQGGVCEQRSQFAWLEGNALRAEAERELIPLIRDADFFTGAVPACLRGVSLGVRYLPSSSAKALHALAAPPKAAAEACARAGVHVDAVARPLRLNWDAAAGRFRRDW